MKSYLIQRGTFKDNIDISTITGIDSIIDFDYMGSSEFEFGAMSKSLKRIINKYRFDPSKSGISVIFTMEGKSFEIVFFGKESDFEYVQTLFQKHYDLEKNYSSFDREYSLKEYLGIAPYFEGKYTKQIKRGCVKVTEKVPNYEYMDFWWDLDNDYMVFPNDKEYHKKFVKAIEALEARGFGKEE